MRRTAAARMRSRALGRASVAVAALPALIIPQNRSEVSAHAVGEPRDTVLPARQRTALVAARLQALLNIGDEIDVLVRHEFVYALVQPLRRPRPQIAARWAIGAVHAPRPVHP